MDHILRETKERFNGGVKLEERNVQFLLFADDLMLVADVERESLHVFQNANLSLTTKRTVY